MMEDFFRFEEDEIKDESILLKIKTYKKIVTTAAEDGNRPFTPEELKKGIKILRELLDDGILAWWDQGFDNFVSDIGPISPTPKKEKLEGE